MSSNTDIVPSGKEPGRTAIIPAPSRDVVAQGNKNDADFILVGDVITDAEVINETKKRKRVELLAATQEEPKKEEPPAQETKAEDAPQPKEGGIWENNKKMIIGGGIALTLITATLFNGGDDKQPAPQPQTQQQARPAILHPVPQITVPTPPVINSATQPQRNAQSTYLPYGTTFTSGLSGNDPNHIRVTRDQKNNKTLLGPLLVLGQLPEETLRRIFDQAVHAPAGSYIPTALNQSGTPATLAMALKLWDDVTPRGQVIAAIEYGHKENLEDKKNGRPLKHLVLHVDPGQPDGMGFGRCTGAICAMPQSMDNASLVTPELQN